MKNVQIFLLIVGVTAVLAVPLDSEDDTPNGKNCRALCAHCGCIGFYCGEECICECSSDNKEGMECVSTMQSNCLKLKLPFEVLIQGPTGNHFIRSAFKFDQNNQQCPSDDKRNKRSTVVIYKPQLSSTESEALLSPGNSIEALEHNKLIKKRAIADDIAADLRERNAIDKAKISSIFNNPSFLAEQQQNIADKISIAATKAREALEAAISKAKSILASITPPAIAGYKSLAKRNVEDYLKVEIQVEPVPEIKEDSSRKDGRESNSIRKLNN